MRKIINNSLRIMFMFGLCLLSGIALVPKNVYAEGDQPPTEEEKIEALKAVALAYYYKGTELQFDDYGMTFQNMRRENKNLVLEDIAPQDIQHTVCVHYATNVIADAFLDENGNNFKFDKTYTFDLASLADPESENYNRDITVDFIKLTGEETEAEIEEYKQRILDEIQPGDIMININASGSGHTRFYYGDDIVLNSTGYSYVYKEKTDIIDRIKVESPYLETFGLDEAGSVRIQSLTNVSLTTAGVFRNDKVKVKKIAILRPANVASGITEKAKKIVKYSGINRTKIASVNKYDSVNLGDTITYTIKLDNKSSENSYNNVPITDKVPNNTEFVSGTNGVNNNNGNLSWSVNVPAKGTVEVSYTVKVKNDNSLIGTKIVSDSTIAAELPLNKIETLVENTLTDSQKKIITDLVDRDGEKYPSTEVLLNNLYPDLNFLSPDEMFKIYFTTESQTFNISDINAFNPVYLRYNKVLQTTEEEIYVLKNEQDMLSANQKLAKMYVKNLFGGLFTSDVSKDVNMDPRNRYFDTNTFMIGDVVLIYDKDDDEYMAGQKNMYLYAGDDRFISVKDGKITLLNQKSENNISIITDSLIGQNSFIVLRPSFSTSKVVVPPKEVDVDNPETGNYIYYVIAGFLVLSLSLLAFGRKKLNIFNKKSIKE